MNWPLFAEWLHTLGFSIGEAVILIFVLALLVEVLAVLTRVARVVVALDERVRRLEARPKAVPAVVPMKEGAN